VTLPSPLKSTTDAAKGGGLLARRAPSGFVVGALVGGAVVGIVALSRPGEPLAVARPAALPLILSPPNLANDAPAPSTSIAPPARPVAIPPRTAPRPRVAEQPLRPPMQTAASAVPSSAPPAASTKDPCGDDFSCVGARPKDAPAGPAKVP
jgi:hypothetical protein